MQKDTPQNPYVIEGDYDETEYFSAEIAPLLDALTDRLQARRLPAAFVIQVAHTGDTGKLACGTHVQSTDGGMRAQVGDKLCGVAAVINNEDEALIQLVITGAANGYTEMVKAVREGRPMPRPGDPIPAGYDNSEVDAFIKQTTGKPDA